MNLKGYLCLLQLYLTPDYSKHVAEAHRILLVRPDVYFFPKAGKKKNACIMIINMLI